MAELLMSEARDGKRQVAGKTRLRLSSTLVSFSSGVSSPFLAAGRPGEPKRDSCVRG